MVVYEKQANVDIKIYRRVGKRGTKYILTSDLIDEAYEAVDIKEGLKKISVPLAKALR